MPWQPSPRQLVNWLSSGSVLRSACLLGNRTGKACVWEGCMWVGQGCSRQCLPALSTMRKAPPKSTRCHPALKWWGQSSMRSGWRCWLTTGLCQCCARGCLHVSVHTHIYIHEARGQPLLWLFMCHLLPFFLRHVFSLGPGACQLG